MATAVQPRRVQPKITLSTGTKPRPSCRIAVLMLSDILALVVSVAASILIKVVVSPPVELTAYVRLFPFVFVFLASYATVGLYSSGLAFGAPEEIRRATFSSATLFVVLAAITIYWRGGTRVLTWPLFVAMLLSIMLVPLFRGAFRMWFSNAGWWGYPTIIVGANETGRLILTAIREQPGLGLNPLAFVDPDAVQRTILGLPVFTDLDAIRCSLNRDMHAYAIVAMPEKTPAELARFIDRELAPTVEHVLLVGSLYELSNWGVRTKSLGNMLGLEIARTKTSNHEISKRILDIVISSCLLVALIPLFILIAIAIKVTDEGPVFFAHRRIGISGRYFKAWKFRTMVNNPEGILERYLLENPESRLEWERDQKLRRDPRVTSIGRFLRKASLDELPQLWNVLRNEMSLVGPRPIIQAEIERYGAAFDFYKSVKGGLTGLWQVSGRNDTTYEERVRLDTMYARNWSVWLDLFILYRTIGVILFRDGAY